MPDYGVVAVGTQHAAVTTRSPSTQKRPSVTKWPGKMSGSQRSTPSRNQQMHLEKYNLYSLVAKSERYVNEILYHARVYELVIILMKLLKTKSLIGGLLRICPLLTILFRNKYLLLTLHSVFYIFLVQCTFVVVLCGQYVRVDDTTDMDVMLDLLVDQWKLKLPSLLISVTGGAKNFHMRPRLKEVFRRGLMKAADSTGILYRYILQVYYTGILYRYTIQVYYTGILHCGMSVAVHEGSR